MILDHSPIRVDNFNGLFGIDSFEESTPADHFIDALNVISRGNEVKTRDGVAVSYTTPSVRRFAIYRRQGEAARVLVLDTSGNLIDTTTGVTILAIAAMTDFAIWYSNNRAYISPHNGNAGLPGEFVYVYTGTGTARKAAGVAPVGSFTATVSGTAGVIEEGTHIFAWLFETSSGFTTAPSPAQVLSFDGTKAVNFTNIPTGPSGTAARRLIASRAIQNYNGNTLGYEMFFVPGGRISDNVTTTLNDIDFYDADLFFSADYTYDQLAEIPAVVFIAPYGKRMCFGGTDTDKNIVYVSKADEPESINEAAGFIVFDPFETEGVKDATEFRDNLYVTKGSGRTYVTRDNNFEASTWSRPIRLDQSIGADVNGIAIYQDSKGSKADFFVVADESGLFKFSGVYEDMPISYKIRNWWDRINSNYFNKLQLVFDQNKFLFYVLVPLDAATSPSHIFVGDYSNGFTATTIRWFIWSFADFNPSSIGIDRDLTTNKTELKIGSLTGNIYVQDEGLKNDVATAINHYVKFALIPSSTSTIHHYGAVGLRVKGTGTLAMTLYGIKEVESQALPSHTLAVNPGKDHLQICHFQSERASLKLALNSVDAYFSLRQMSLYTNVIYHSRPA